MNQMGPKGVQEKFHRYAESRVPLTQRDAIVQAVDGLEEAPSVRDLMLLVALP